MKLQVQEIAQNNDITAFEEEIAKPTNPAMGTTAPKGPAPVYNTMPPPPGPSPKPVNPDEPMFKEEDTQANEDTTGSAAPEQKPIFDEGYKEEMIGYYLDMEEMGLGWLACKITKTDNPKVFYYSEQTKKMILLALKPYRDFIIEKLPAWLPILIVYGGAKVDYCFQVYAMVQTNKANKKGRNDGETMSKLRDTVSQPGERKNYLLYIDGYYKNDRAGVYIKNREGDGAKRLDKPQIKDLDKILAVKSNNHPDLICNAFDITEADFAQHGIVLKND